MFIPHQIYKGVWTIWTSGSVLLSGVATMDVKFWRCSTCAALLLRVLCAPGLSMFPEYLVFGLVSLLLRDLGSRIVHLSENCATLREFLLITGVLTESCLCHNISYEFGLSRSFTPYFKRDKIFKNSSNK